MAQVHHRNAQVGGRTVFYREAGDPGAPHVVLLHGCPASSYMYRALIPRLATTFHVVAPDLPGFGLSAAPPVDEFEYTFEHLADAMEALLAELGIAEYSMIVQDYGAPTGWRLALRHPERVRSIVTQNGNAYDEGFVAAFWDPLWRYAETRSARDAEPLLTALSEAGIRWQYTHGVPDPDLVDPDSWRHDCALVSRPGNPEIQLALFADYPSNVALYPAVHEYFRASQVPLLAVWGRNDEIFGPAGAEAFRRDLPAAEIHLLDGGHFLLESHLDEAEPLITGFLTRAQGAAAPAAA
ncbi:alpha/beta fold hydrolase [Dactylosporangium sp. CA-233914]|uniref:alpha/beta fold hydrolase n=1 Tax=Dactylosporangium sp. CA-233914 TaxID=3239934 RepID=UPI003D8B8898